MPAGGPTRVLCLGNDLVADDALGVVAARWLCRRLAGLGAPLPPGPRSSHWRTRPAVEQVRDHE